MRAANNRSILMDSDLWSPHIIEEYRQVESHLKEPISSLDSTFKRARMNLVVTPKHHEYLCSCSNCRELYHDLDQM